MNLVKVYLKIAKIMSIKPLQMKVNYTVNIFYVTSKYIFLKKLWVDPFTCALFHPFMGDSSDSSLLRLSEPFGGMAAGPFIHIFFQVMIGPAHF